MLISITLIPSVFIAFYCSLHNKGKLKWNINEGPHLKRSRFWAPILIPRSWLSHQELEQGCKRGGSEPGRRAARGESCCVCGSMVTSGSLGAAACALGKNSLPSVFPAGWVSFDFLLGFVTPGGLFTVHEAQCWRLSLSCVGRAALSSRSVVVRALRAVMNLCLAVCFKKLCGF